MLELTTYRIGTEVQHDPTRLSNLHAYFNRLLPFGRGIELQHKSRTGVPMKSKFEEWFQQQPFYLNLRFIHGDRLFISENSVYRVLAVQIAWLAWQEQQKRIDELESKVTDLSKNLKDRELAVLMRQEKIDAVEQTLVELNEASEALHHRWHIFNEQTDLSEAEGIDLAIKYIKQALKGGDE